MQSALEGCCRVKLLLGRAQDLQGRAATLAQQAVCPTTIQGNEAGLTGSLWYIRMLPGLHICTLNPPAGPPQSGSLLPQTAPGSWTSAGSRAASRGCCERRRRIGRGAAAGAGREVIVKVQPAWHGCRRLTAASCRLPGRQMHRGQATSIQWPPWNDAGAPVWRA